LNGVFHIKFLTSYPFKTTLGTNGLTSRSGPKVDVDCGRWSGGVGGVEKRIVLVTDLMTLWW